MAKKRMTIEQFLKQLVALKGQFKIDKVSGCIRTTSSGNCPIEALAGKIGAWSVAGPKLGLNDEDIDNIITAVDYEEGWLKKYQQSDCVNLRRQIKKAVGLAILIFFLAVGHTLAQEPIPVQKPNR